MRRNVILSVVAVLALAIAGIGGVFANYSDIETSQDNYFQTGSLDLKVSVDGVEYDDPVPEIFRVVSGWPCCSKDRVFDLHNAGEGEQEPPVVYMHFKNYNCTSIECKDPYAYIKCEDGECILSDEHDPEAWPVTEPEYVAECGGIAGEDVNGNLVTVPGIGCCYGDCCQLAKHIDIFVRISEDDGKTWEMLDLIAMGLDKNGNGVVKLDEIECEQIELADLPGCNTILVNVSLHLQDVPEEYFGMNYFDESIEAEAKWNDWPTNALMRDQLMFDISFELLQD